MLVVRVKDLGIGMSEEESQNVFKPFNQSKFSKNKSIKP